MLLGLPPFLKWLIHTTSSCARTNQKFADGRQFVRHLQAVDEDQQAVAIKVYNKSQADLGSEAFLKTTMNCWWTVENHEDNDWKYIPNELWIIISTIWTMDDHMNIWCWVSIINNNGIADWLWIAVRLQQATQPPIRCWCFIPPIFGDNAGTVYYCFTNMVVQPYIDIINNIQAVSMNINLQLVITQHTKHPRY